MNIDTIFINQLFLFKALWIIEAYKSCVMCLVS